MEVSVKRLPPQMIRRTILSGPAGGVVGALLHAIAGCHNQTLAWWHLECLASLRNHHSHDKESFVAVFSCRVLSGYSHCCAGGGFNRTMAKGGSLRVVLSHRARTRSRLLTIGFATVLSARGAGAISQRACSAVTKLDARALKKPLLLLQLMIKVAQRELARSGCAMY